MRHDYSIRADGRVCWYSDAWGSLLFDWSLASLASNDASGTGRVLLDEAPLRGRSQGWCRLFCPRSREKNAVERMKRWFEAQGKAVVIVPSCLNGSVRGGYTYHDTFGRMRFFCDVGVNIHGNIGVQLDTKPMKDYSSGVYGCFVPEGRRQAAIRQITVYLEELGYRVFLE